MGRGCNFEDVHRLMIFSSRPQWKIRGGILECNRRVRREAQGEAFVAWEMPETGHLVDNGERKSGQE